MDEQALLKKLIQTFPKTRIMPRFDYNPKGCEGCVACGHSTTLLCGGSPWHRPCKLQSMGIPVD